jgi:hypothetical protein|tara:strand:- start:223 stop:537 length:315 start_codon:yes stop_codon:yes gene_type:complete
MEQGVGEREIQRVEISRTIVKNSLKDFCSIDDKKRFLVSDWWGTEDFKMICANAQIDEETLAIVFIRLATLPTGKRKKEVSDLISTIDSFPPNEKGETLKSLLD